MTLLKYLRVLLLSLYWKLPQAKEVDLLGQTEVARHLERKKVKRKRLKKKKQKQPRIIKKVFRHQSFRNTSPKDLRFSNQRKLRKMYRGM